MRWSSPTTSRAILASLFALSGAYWSGVMLGYRWGARAGWEQAAAQANRLIELAKKGAA